MKKNEIISDLSWDLNLYKKNNIVPPQRIKENPSKTEGQLMSEEEIEGLFLESIRVLRVTKEEDSVLFEKIKRSFIADLEYLFKLGKINQDVVDFAKDKENFNF